LKAIRILAVSKVYPNNDEEYYATEEVIPGAWYEKGKEKWRFGTRLLYS
jgi:hypothetical protein